MFNVNKLQQNIFRCYAAAVAFYHLYIALTGTPYTYIQRPLHLGLVFVYLFYVKGRKTNKGKNKLELIDIFFIIVITVITFYTLANASRFSTRFLYISPVTFWDKIFGVVLVLIVLEAGRRVAGLGLPIVTGVFILYAYFGKYIPGYFGHGGISFIKLIELFYLTEDGIWGAPLYAASTYVIMFTIFGSSLLASGIGAFFNKLAWKLSGKTKAGPAKTAVIASYFMGMASGGSSMNVVTTGSFTIPLMKEAGYKPEFAAGVEAAASTGGQIMPPVMGVAAFIMAEITGIPYIQIVKHAILPGLLYFLSIYMSVHFRANSPVSELKIIEKSKIDSSLEPAINPKNTTFNKGNPLLKDIYLLLPVFVMVYLLLQGRTPQLAAFWSVVAVIIISSLTKRTRMSLTNIIDTLERGVRLVIPVTAACAVAGIIVGVVQITGLSVKIMNLVLLWGFGYLPIILFLTMIVALILGMGMPTSAVYIIMASLLAPGLVRMGLPLIAAHMFVFYFGCLSAVTPPVALSSFAAAAIGEADITKTSLVALKLALVGFIVPYMFVYGPALLFIGSWQNITIATITAILGVIIIAASIEGWAYVWISIPSRILLFVGAIFLITPFFRWSAIGIMLIIIAATINKIILGLRRREGVK